MVVSKCLNVFTVHYNKYGVLQDGELFNKATIDLAGLDNTGQRNSPSDSVIQVIYIWP